MEHEPALLNALSFEPNDLGSCEWDAEFRSRHLTVSNNGKTVEWDPKNHAHGGSFSRASLSEIEALKPIAWVPAKTRLKLHSGQFHLDFSIENMGRAQIGVGFMLLWDVGEDWGFFGYLGASTSAWAYDPSTGDVVRATKSIEGGLPKIDKKRGGIVSLELRLPRNDRGEARFVTKGVPSRPIALPVGSVVLPAACLLSESQRVTISRYEQVA